MLVGCKSPKERREYSLSSIRILIEYPLARATRITLSEVLQFVFGCAFILPILVELIKFNLNEIRAAIWTKASSNGAS